MIKTCLLGTGGMIPLKNRWLTSCYIECNGRAALIDCGEGTQIAISETDCRLSHIDAVFITHIHADHVSGLPGFLLSLGNSSRTEPLDLYIPKNTKESIKKLLCICGYLPYELRIHELSLSEVSEIPLKQIDPMLIVKSLPVKHTTACLGYSFTFNRKPVFLPEKAKSLNIPVKLWSRLHKKETITLEDGRIITPDMVTEDSRKPIKISYVTDTLPLEEIIPFAENSDLFICEGMYGDTEKKESLNEKRHMLMQDACMLAKRAGVSRLWLTHYSPAEKDPGIYREILEKIFPNTIISKDGENIEL